MGGGGKFGRNRIIIFSMSSAGQFIFRFTKAKIFIFAGNKILKKQKKKNKKNNKIKRARGWNAGSEERQDRTFQCDFFCRLLVSASSVYINGAAACLNEFI